jgi:uncharacterized protein DUF4124
MRSLNPMLVAVMVASLAMADAAAETLYKLIDKNGKVTYVQDPPKDFDGKVIRLDIDPNANTTTGRPPAKAEPPKVDFGAARRGEGERTQKLSDAQGKLEAARKAYQDAVDHPREGEVERVGNVNGFTRPVFSEAYQKRLDQLQAEVKRAEQDVQQLERGR